MGFVGYYIIYITTWHLGVLYTIPYFTNYWELGYNRGISHQIKIFKILHQIKVSKNFPKTKRAF
jgi:hypothetical protein